MAAISLSLQRGNDGFHISDFTVGVLAPGANDFEFRYNTTDANAVTVTRKDVVQALEAITRAIESDALFITPLGI